MMRTTTLALLLGVVATGCDQPTSTNLETSALSLTGSTFEIDNDANLIVDATGMLDWGTVTESRKVDTASGQSDSSYSGGGKEDDLCPAVGTGSIPNNKSDLKQFGVYVEPGTASTGAGYMHLFWSRVQDPSGTTLMDFEFNQSSTTCANGVNPVRTAGDLLLEYRLEQGGATATLKLREWSGSAWGAATDLTAAGAATGTINSTAITAGNADGLGALGARTFGEASIDLDYIFDEASCTSFGSAFVKSRSSDAFTSALKDFIAPTPVNISNCGGVVIRKETDPDGQTGSFTFTHNLETDPVTVGTTFPLGDGQSKEFTNVLFGTGYTVTEGAPSGGFDLASIDCTASTGVTPTVDLATRTITFDIDDETDIVDCTYTNRARGTIVIEKVADAAGTFAFTSGQLGAFNLSTTAAGQAGKGSTTFSDRAPGTYSVAETVPAGWSLTGATCSDGSPVTAIALAAGETVTCTFTNARQQGAIRIVKTRNHAADGAGPHAHAGVTFRVSGGDLTAPVDVVTNADGVACLGGRTLSSFVGNYAVTEIVPTGYLVVGGAGPRAVAVVTAGATCPNGDAVAFHNVPLTTVTVTVDSLVTGGTSSVITCTGFPAFPTPASGDGSLVLPSLGAGTYTCTVVIQ